MTALFSTAETFTATSALGAFLTNAPAELAVLSLAEPRAGRKVVAAASIAMTASIAPAGGVAAVYAQLEMAYASAIAPATGGMIALEAQDWALQLTPFSVSSGGMAALVTDVIVIDYPPTAAFSTATLEWTERLIRVPHEVNVHFDLAALSGANVEVAAGTQTIPNDHGPVARSRAVQAQIVMS